MLEHRDEFCRYGNKEDFWTVGLVFFQALKSRLVAGFSGTGLVYFW
ncbi:hypothetical protein [Pseudomonas gozinkensis]|nr:hypothetical protein [Pseudomonas gozinkensis]